MKKLLFAILGGILGIPLSYYFQPEIVRAKTGSIGGYLENFGDILENSDLVGNVLLSVVIFAIIGGVIGYLIDIAQAKTTKAEDQTLSTSVFEGNNEKGKTFCTNSGASIEDEDTDFCTNCGAKL